LNGHQYRDSVITPVQGLITQTSFVRKQSKKKEKDAADGKSTPNNGAKVGDKRTMNDIY
jgi:hypothetical protein